MDLSGILSISGYSGLFKLIKQTKTGFVVESMHDNKRMQAFASSKISTLDDIAIYTEEGEEHLKELFRKIFKKEEGKETISHKSSDIELKTFFEEILPDYDKTRVYTSDIKKVINWYNILVAKGLIDLEEDKKEDETEKDSSEELPQNEELNK
ncbi:MAG: DUF5606 domain-containing protein [Bacteroidales bacterium]|nr:DUF5606 domain-containing protein [Bacteroidales bacterium]MBN2757084.1 DUF5606 domain-containing protein [Bacteroidales bacterium]